MDELRDQHAHGREAMIAAFAELTTLALRAGADSDDVTALHGRFFDGNVDVKKAWRCVLLLAEIYVSGQRARGSEEAPRPHDGA